MIEDGNFAVSRHPFPVNSLIGRQRAGRAEQGDRQMVSFLQEGANIVRR